MIICSAQQLTGFQSNGPGLEYKVQWRQKDVDEDWSSKNVANVSELVVPGTPTYVPYEIMVQAVNDYGEGPQPEMVIGYSGEDCESTFWNGMCCCRIGLSKRQVFQNLSNAHGAAAAVLYMQKGFTTYFILFLS